MRKFLTTGLFGAILGLAVGTPADASLISRSFLDEALTSYATTTALDLKANQSDLTDLSDKIGTLPTEIVIGNSNGSIDMFNITKRQSVSLPKDYTLSDFIQDMYYGSFGSNVGLDSSPFYGLSDIIDHVMYGGITGEASPLADKQYKGLIDVTLEINKIGTVPDGKNLAGMISETDAKIGLLPPDTTVAGMMGNPVLLNREQTIIPLYDLILWGSNGQMVMNPITGMTMPFPLLGLHDITHKIGTLPTEYATVGAALTAIKGIAEEAKAAALAAIPDPKTEGSTGKFVLTVDIVGDNATYRWEKIDREGETTTTE